MNRTAVILLMGSLALAAQTPRFGVQAAISLPASDLSDNADLGLQAGGHVRWSFNHGQGIMARVDVASYGENDGVKVRGVALAADYLYHLERRDRGLYLLAGLASQHYHTAYDGYSDNDDALGLDLGVGYDLDRHLGLQARYTTSSLSNVTYDALNLGVTYTF